MANISIPDNRNQSIDLIKIIAMCLVVCLHTTHNYMIPGVISIEFILYNSSVIAIPLFFMVSGYLLIGRKNTTYKYAGKKIWGILRFMFFIIGSWWLIYSIIKGYDLKSLLFNYIGAFIQKGHFWMFWYFGTMCLIYCLYPLINQLSKYKKYYLSVLILIGIFQNLMFSWNLISSDGEENIAQSLRVWNWFFYFMLGGILKRVVLDKKFLIALMLITIIANLAIIWWLSPFVGSSYCEYFYSCPIVILLSTVLFIIVKEFHFKNNRLITSLSLLFLPVYTLHPFVIKAFNLVGINKYGGIIFYFTVLFASILGCWILMKIPIVKKMFRI